MSENQNQGGFNARPFVIFVVLVILAMVVYQFATGGVFQEVSIPNLFRIIFVTPTPTPPPPPPPTPELSRDFVIGRWLVEQANGDLGGGTVIDYKKNGTFTGQVTQFVGEVGRRGSTSGNWEFEGMSDNTFQLNLEFNDGRAWTGTFKVIDRNRIHNIDQNYIAVRAK